MSKSKFREFAKYLLLAQTASDSGKGWGSSAHNADNAQAAGYGLKDDYIRQAIAAARHCSNVRVEQKGDLGLYDMNVIYFTIMNVGQVSFHSFSSFSGVPKTGCWKGNQGESQMVCHKLNRSLNLQCYG